MFADIFGNFTDLGALGPPDPINCDAALDNYDRVKYFLNHCTPMNDTERRNMLMIVQEMYNQLKMEAHLGNQFLVPILIAYTIMIMFGAGGSGLVIYVVARNKVMRSPRNVFIVNLAISDLTLCLFTQPFNLLRLLYAHQEWTLGNFMCKMTAMFQGTNIFVSTISITAIALDRFQVIVYPTRAATQTVGAIKALLLIWIISLLMASPLVIFSKVVTTPALQCTETVTENYIRRAKVAYSITSMIVQYLAPLVIVTIAYTRICLRIKYRLVNQRQRFNSAAPPAPSLPSTNTNIAGNNLDNFNRNVQRKLATESHRQRRTNMLLASIGVAFALSWLPLNIFNIIMDYKERAFHAKVNTRSIGPPPPPMMGGAESTEQPISALDVRTVILIQTMCLLAVLISACTNPVLYGWLNENFRREFRTILYCKLSRGETDGNNSNASRKQMNHLHRISPPCVELTSTPAVVLLQQENGDGITTKTLLNDNTSAVSVSTFACAQINHDNAQQEHVAFLPPSL